MPMGNIFETDLLKLIFNGTAIANLVDNAATAPLTSLYIAGHTADPGDNGNQSTNEIAYTGYARVAATRNSGGWTVTGDSVSPTVRIDFPSGTGGSGTMRYISIGTAASGAGKILFSGAITPNIVCGNAITPELATTSSISFTNPVV